MKRQSRKTVNKHFKFTLRALNRLGKVCILCSSLKKWRNPSNMCIPLGGGLLCGTYWDVEKILWIENGQWRTNEEVNDSTLCSLFVFISWTYPAMEQWEKKWEAKLTSLGWSVREDFVWRLTYSGRSGEADCEWGCIRGFLIHFRHVLPCYCRITIVAKGVSSGELLGGCRCWSGESLAVPFFPFFVNSNFLTNTDLAIIGFALRSDVRACGVK